VDENVPGPVPLPGAAAKPDAKWRSSLYSSLGVNSSDATPAPAPVDSVAADPDIELGASAWLPLPRSTPTRLNPDEPMDLFDYIFYPRKRFGEKYGLYIFKEIINALEYTHRKNIVHRDVKTENIMIGSDWKIKLTDYGFAKINKYKLLSSFVGTKSYAPPEILSHNKYLGLPCDVFSCGATLFLIVTGQKPFGQIGCAS
jgi:hypothetical protein